MKQLQPKSEPPMSTYDQWGICVLALFLISITTWILLPTVVMGCLMLFELNCKLWSQLLDLTF